MKTKPIKADLTDIIFEGRFRAYGAYQLRKLYNQRLAIATFIGLGLFFAGVGAPNLIPGKKRLNHGVGGASAFLDTVVVEFVDQKKLKKQRRRDSIWTTRCFLDTIIFSHKFTNPEFVFKMPRPKNMGKGNQKIFREMNIYPDMLTDTPRLDSPITYFTYSEPEPVNYDSIRELIGYPGIALENEIQGMVVVRVHLDTTGRVIEWKIIKKAHPILDNAVEEHIGKLRFTSVPSKVPSWLLYMNVPFRFHMFK